MTDMGSPLPKEEKMSKETILAVLEKAAGDFGFFGQLATDYAKALKNYDLSSEEAMRIGTGDLGWIESYLGMKVEPELVEKVFVPLLSREVW